MVEEELEKMRASCFDCQVEEVIKPGFMGSSIHVIAGEGALSFSQVQLPLLIIRFYIWLCISYLIEKIIKSSWSFHRNPSPPFESRFLLISIGN